MALTASTFARVTAVLVDGGFPRTDIGLYPDASLQPGGVNASSVVPLNGPTATAGQLWRGMPAYILPTTGMLVPPNNQASGTAAYLGVLVDDLTTFVLAKGTKVTYATGGKVRTYAATTLAPGDPVTADTGSGPVPFAGFRKWLTGVDDPGILHGHAFPLDDGSAENGASAATSMVQGNTIFVNLRG